MMPVSWNVPLIILSVLVAIIGSFTALTHAVRMRLGSGQAVNVWMLAGGMTLGLAIWSMHFIGMLALQLPIPISYDIQITLLSMLPAIGAALLGFAVLRDATISTARIIGASLLMGIGISVMHYTGMAALAMSPAFDYHVPTVALSVVIAIVAASGALLMMYRGEQIGLRPLPRFCLGGLVMGSAISGMHYTAMYALNIHPNTVALADAVQIEPAVLAIMVSLICLLWFVGGTLATYFDQYVARQHASAMDQLQAAHEELYTRAQQMADDMTQELREKDERVQLLLESVAEAIFGVDLLGRCTFVNTPCLNILGYRREELFGQYIHDLIHHTRADGSPYPKEKSIIHRAFLINEQRHSDEEIFWRRDGTSFPVECWSHPIYHDGQVVGAVTTFFDITHRKAAEDEIQSLAFYDPLTRLPNRRLLMDRLHQALASSARGGWYGALLFIDLDHFKSLNDTLGHDKGDLLLQQVASRLPACVREGDTVARLGGDEFVIILEDLCDNPQEAAVQTEIIGETILAALNKPYQLVGHEYHSTPSIGITLFSGHHESIDDLLKQADIAMYQAKAASRNALRFFDTEMQAAISARVSLETDLRQSLRQNDFFLYYQAQVDGEGRMTGAEALVRWQHPQRGLVSPTEFISLAEDTGLIQPLGQWVLEAACAQLVVWSFQTEQAHLTLSVNVSAHQFRHPSFVEQVLAVLEKSGADPHKLKLELTESLLLHDVEDIINKMTALKSKGVGFSLDDFGTGYSSLSYLKRLPLDQLKIDQSFVRDVLTDPNDAIIIRTIIVLGQSLGLAVLAEGVESEVQRDFLARQGCNAFQGSLFGQPLPAKQLEQLASA